MQQPQRLEEGCSVALLRQLPLVPVFLVQRLLLPIYLPLHPDHLGSQLALPQVCLQLLPVLVLLWVFLSLSEWHPALRAAL